MPLTATVLGTIGTVFWCVQLLPQMWYNWRRKKTDGLPPAMMFLWASCEYINIPFFQFQIMEKVLTVLIKAQCRWVFIWYCRYVHTCPHGRLYENILKGILLTCIAYYIGSQPASPDPAADLWILCPCQLGSDSVLQLVSSNYLLPTYPQTRP